MKKEKINYEQSIDELLDAVGGKDNIKNYEHCATRLRLILSDDSKVDEEKVKEISECKGYFFNTGQHQFIYGTGKVDEAFAVLAARMGGSTSSSDANFKEDVYKNLSPVQKVVRILADILVPLIPALVTTGLLMGIKGLVQNLGIPLDKNLMAIFTVLTDTAFAFLPVLISYSATKRFGGNPILGIVLGLMMVAPQLPNAWDVSSGKVSPLHVFGLNVVGYQGSIIPAIFGGLILSKLELKLRKIVPSVMDLVITPFVSLTVTILLMLFGLGPILHWVESGVIGFVEILIKMPFGIGYVLFGGLQQLLVVTGLHHTLSIIEIHLLETTKHDVLQTLMTVSMAGQLGACIGAVSLMKNKVDKTNSISAASSTLFGITEPLLFGVNLRCMNVLLSGVAGGAVGGLLVYIFKLSATGMGITFLPGLLLYTDNMMHMLLYVVVILVAAFVGFTLVRLQSKKVSDAMNS